MREALSESWPSDPSKRTQPTFKTVFPERDGKLRSPFPLPCQAVPPAVPGEGGGFPGPGVTSWSRSCCTTGEDRITSALLIYNDGFK